MKNYLLLILLVFTLGFVNSQNSEVLADSYYKKGEFNKALVIYENLNKEKPYNYNYLFKLIDTHQQLEQFDAAENIFSLVKITLKDIFDHRASAASNIVSYARKESNHD